MGKIRITTRFPKAVPQEEQKKTSVRFPEALTEEELVLKQKYTILRKKKELLKKPNAPLPKPKKVEPVQVPKNPIDAKELAIQLVKSGKVSIAAKSTTENRVFKRPRVLERKLSASGKGLGGASGGHVSVPDTASASTSPVQPNLEPIIPNKNGEEGVILFKRFCADVPKSILETPKAEAPPANTSVAKGSLSLPQAPSFPDPLSSRPGKPISVPKRGPTIYVGARNLTEDNLRAIFKGFGEIVKIELHSPGVGFVTFESAEVAERAIKETRGKIWDGVTIHVQFARHQPHSCLSMVDGSSAPTQWASLALNLSKKSVHDGWRKQVVYADALDMRIPN